MTFKSVEILFAMVDICFSIYAFDLTLLILNIMLSLFAQMLSKSKLPLGSDDDIGYFFSRMLKMSSFSDLDTYLQIKVLIAIDEALRIWPKESQTLLNQSCDLTFLGENVMSHYDFLLSYISASIIVRLQPPRTRQSLADVSRKRLWPKQIISPYDNLPMQLLRGGRQELIPALQMLWQLEKTNVHSIDIHGLTYEVHGVVKKWNGMLVHALISNTISPPTKVAILEIDPTTCTVSGEKMDCVISVKATQSMSILLDHVPMDLASLNFKDLAGARGFVGELSSSIIQRDVPVILSGQSAAISVAKRLPESQYLAEKQKVKTVAEFMHETDPSVKWRENRLSAILKPPIDSTVAARTLDTNANPAPNPLPLTDHQRGSRKVAKRTYGTKRTPTVPSSSNKTIDTFIQPGLKPSDFSDCVKVLSFDEPKTSKKPPGKLSALLSDSQLDLRGAKEIQSRTPCPKGPPKVKSAMALKNASVQTEINSLKAAKSGKRKNAKIVQKQVRKAERKTNLLKSLAQFDESPKIKEFLKAPVSEVMKKSTLPEDFMEWITDEPSMPNLNENSNMELDCSPVSVLGLPDSHISKDSAVEKAPISTLILPR